MRLLSPKELALAIGVSESSLKRWADEGLIRVTRTAGGHRRIPMAEAIRFVRDSEATLVRPDILALPDVEVVAADLPARAEETRRLLTYLLEGRTRHARGLIMSIYLAGRSVAEICDGPIREAMQHIGELWRHSDEGIFIEHRATDICLQAIDQLRLTFAVPEDAPVAVGGAPAGDPYLLPTIMAATTLRSEGFHAINLGPDTPTEAMVHAARHHAARLVWLTVSARQQRAKLLEEISALQAGLAKINIDLIIGGRAVGGLAVPDTANVHIGGSMSDLISIAKSIAPPGEIESA